MNLPPACPSRELFERSLESVSRALARDAGLHINFAGGQADTDSRSVYLPLPIENLAAAQIATERGMCDMTAVKIRYHDPGLHRSLAPDGPLSLAIYNLLEDIRIEACASQFMAGVAANLSALFAYKFLLHGLNVLETDTATSLANAFVLSVRARLLGKPLPQTAARLVGRWQDEITRHCGRGIQALLAMVENQAKFAEQSLLLISKLELTDMPEKGSQAKPAETPSHSYAEEARMDHGGGESKHGDDDGPESAGAGSLEAGEDDGQDRSGLGDGEPEAGSSNSVIPFPQDQDREPVAASLDAIEGTPEEPGVAVQKPVTIAAYHAYTTRFDEVVHARDLVGKGQLKHLREQLDQEISEHRRTAIKLAKRLQNSLRTLQKRAWTFDLDDGLLNTSRLSRLVMDPVSPLAYKQEHEDQSRDTAVSFLIDNSGSMRGQPITLAAMFTDILAMALERCHVGTEILGFTTRQWRGGQAAQSWRKNNKPADPGRLSDLRHVIYKTTDESWRRARPALGVMLWPELLKENIDGEALLWAHRRLAGRQEQRRILVVVSDGVPADDATLTGNSNDYLETHLRQVVEWIETKSSVELLAIGIGHDVNAIYRRSVTITDSEQLGDAMAHELIELLANVPPAARRPFAVTC